MDKPAEMCPLLCIQPEEYTTNCMKGKCAWWRDGCAFVRVAVALELIARVLVKDKEEAE